MPHVCGGLVSPWPMATVYPRLLQRQLEGPLRDSHFRRSPFRRLTPCPAGFLSLLHFPTTLLSSVSLY